MKNVGHVSETGIATCSTCGVEPVSIDRDPGYDVPGLPSECPRCCGDESAHPPAGTYHCPTCGSTRVQGTAWVELNGDALVNDEPPDDTYWCPDCDVAGWDGNFEKHVCINDGVGCCQVCKDPIQKPHAIDCDLDEDCTCGGRP